MRYALFVLTLLCLTAAGCRQRDGSPSAERLDVAEYGALPGLKATPNSELRDELDRIIEEGGTPEQLSEIEIPAAGNVAAELLDLFPKERVGAILEQSERLFPPGRFEFNPAQLQRANDFRKQYDASRLRARAALKRPQCDFDIEFTAGFLAEMEFIPVVRICARLEAFRAAESLAADKPIGAVESLRAMLRLAQRLGAEPHIEARLQAAFLRTEAFGVLQAIVLDDNIASSHLVQLQETVEEHLSDWPHDADAWIGDRAMGLHAYEMVRDGNLTGLLTVRELDLFAKEGDIGDLSDAAKRNVDHDELYYLKTMRKIIDSCSRPYCQRLSLLRSIREELQQMRGSSDFPAVAARLLLADVEKGHAMQAQDRANWEAWALALAGATGRTSPPFETNPLTGENYLQTKQGEFIIVENFGSGVDGDHPSIMVPCPDAKAADQDADM